MKAPTTPVKPRVTSLNVFDRFQTVGDPVLERMKTESARFVQDALDRKTPRWLSLVGSSGTGKTFLARMILERLWKSELYSHSLLKCGVLLQEWPAMLSKMREGSFYLSADCGLANLLVLDEVMIGHDPNGFAADKLAGILSSRVGKWTVITSNLTIQAIGVIDTRISSRMFRDGSVVVKCDTIDWGLR